VRGKETWTYEGGKCIEIECRIDGHVACPNAENINATSEIWRSHV
jgi:hypothetical protein